MRCGSDERSAKRGESLRVARRKLNAKRRGSRADLSLAVAVRSSSAYVNSIERIILPLRPFAGVPVPPGTVRLPALLVAGLP